MGGPGSGRHAIALAEKKSTGCIAVNANISWRVIDATLKQAEADAKNGKIPPSGVLSLAQWAIEMKEGKPTQKIDAAVSGSVAIDPSLMVAALRQARLEGQAFLERDEPDITAHSERDVAQSTFCDIPKPMQLAQGTRECDVQVAQCTDGGGI